MENTENGGKKPFLRLNDATIKAIESVVNKGDRVEIVPVKDGLKVLRVRRKIVKTEQKVSYSKCRKEHGMEQE